MENNVGQHGADKPVEPEEPSNHAAEEVDDPDEGDLDDLDDMLDQFSATKVDDKKEPPSAPKPAEKAKEPQLSEAPELDTDDFSKQLQEQMAALMGSMDESPDMKREIENIMKELGEEAEKEASKEDPKGRSGGPSTAAKEPAGPEDAFQETIRKTMERMQASGDQASAATGSGDPDDILAQLMGNLPEGDVEGLGNEEGFNKMLLGMMEQLTKKEILYEPMKELHDKYPAWLEKNKAKTKPEDMQRYEKQQKLVKEIVDKFDNKGYSDENAKDREFIVDRMQQMQAAGSPPADLVGDMNDALGDLESGCPQQ